MAKIQITVIIPGYSRSVHRTISQLSAHKMQSENSFDWQDGAECLPWQIQLARRLQLVAVDSYRIPLAGWLAATFTAGTRTRTGADADANPNADLSRQPKIVACIDPVHISTSINSAHLVPANALDISDQEACDIIDSLNKFFVEDELHFFQFSNELWGITGLPDEQFDFLPASFVANQNLPEKLTAAFASDDVKKWFSEIQMLLHNHPVNLVRETLGKPVINTLWFWGSAELPLSIARCGSNSVTQTVLADDVIARSIASVSKVTVKPLTTPLGELTQNTVVIDLRLSQALLRKDSDELILAYQLIKDQWLDPFLNKELVKSHSLCLLNENGDQALFQHPQFSLLSTMRLFVRALPHRITSKLVRITRR